MLTTLTTKGQVTLPIAARRQLGLEPGCRLEVVVTEDGHLEVIPVSQSVRVLKGMVPRPEKTLSVAEMERAIEAGATS